MIYHIIVDDGPNRYQLETGSDFEVIKFVAFLNSKEDDVDLFSERVQVDLDLLEECKK